MPKHAYLSASASHRWLACPPSAKLCANIADQTSEYAQQGTDCHELCAYLVEKALGRAVTVRQKILPSMMQRCRTAQRNTEIMYWSRLKQPKNSAKIRRS